jgi:glycine cleavage system regulatory protein
MQVPLVMTILGKDRPGLVDLVAGLVVEHGGNWLESRMCHLGGEFAGILRVHVPAEHEQSLIRALNNLGPQGLTVAVRPDCAPPADARRRLARLEIIGHDRPGIVRQISHALAAHNVNVEELSTECGSAPMSGETLFRAQAKLQVPDTCPLPELRQALERIAADLAVDVSLEELPAEAKPAAR